MKFKVSLSKESNPKIDNLLKLVQLNKSKKKRWLKRVSANFLSRKPVRHKLSNLLQMKRWSRKNQGYWRASLNQWWDHKTDFVWLITYILSIFNYQYSPLISLFIAFSFSVIPSKVCWIISNSTSLFLLLSNPLWLLYCWGEYKYLSTAFSNALICSYKVIF